MAVVCPGECVVGVSLKAPWCFLQNVLKDLSVVMPHDHRRMRQSRGSVKEMHESIRASSNEDKLGYYTPSSTYKVRLPVCLPY